MEGLVNNRYTLLPFVIQLHGAMGNYLHYYFVAQSNKAKSDNIKLHLNAAITSVALWGRMQILFIDT